MSLTNLSYEDTQRLTDLIRTIVRQEMKNNSTNVVYTYTGLIKSVDGNGKFTVSIPSDGSVYTNLINQTGTSLAVGDSVTIYAKGGKIGNAVISVKNGVTIAT